LDYNKNMKFIKGVWIILIIGLVLFFLVPLQPAFAQDSGTPTVIVLTSSGPISPVMIEYIERGLKIAASQGAAAVILQLDTPGGAIDTMNNIVQVIRSSTIPVIVYVSPNNAMAGSAGTVISLAGHLTAMAPETTIGAASPVGSQGEDLGQTLATKEKEILKASIRGLTINRPAAATALAESMIDNAKAATVDEALQIGLIDFKAANLNDLVNQMDGYTVNINGTTVTLHTLNANIVTVNNNILEQLLLLLLNPNLLFILIAVGVQAILIELSHPGAWVPGFIGAICMLLAVYGLGILPVNWFGILFIILAFILFIVDIKAPTHGALTAAGLASFITGSLVLFSSVQLPGVPRISIPLVVGTGVFFAAGFFTILTIGLRAQSAPPAMGSSTLIGKTGYTTTDLNPLGMAQVAGEQWSVQLVDNEDPLKKGEKVVVIAVEGLRLRVKRS
jgi:membrane-bound serine protease (ClpP class)